MPSTLSITPPLLNSACPWATTEAQLAALYSSPHTGAITIRTSLLDGFAHDDAVHRYTFFSAAAGHAAPPGHGGSVAALAQPHDLTPAALTSSLNTLGYSPLALPAYLDILHRAAAGRIPAWAPRPDKPIIVSVSGSPQDVAACYAHVHALAARHPATLALALEVNLSCPNVPDLPPPAYDGRALGRYLARLRAAQLAAAGPALPVGLKTPPYTYAGQFSTLIAALERAATTATGDEGEGEAEGENAAAATAPRCPIAFITATNTLGGCLVMTPPPPALREPPTTPHVVPALPSPAGTGIGGMAGDALHALALGNVATLRRALDASPVSSVRDIRLIGVGGVKDAAGAARMRVAGAEWVALATALGRDGLDVFEKMASSH